VTCAQHALWYHLSKFLVDGNMPSINVEDWELFLMDCNTTGELLGYVCLCVAPTLSAPL
jgi:hypothetical protein